jgi:hypothetical protein
VQLVQGRGDGVVEVHRAAPFQQVQRLGIEVHEARDIAGGLAFDRLDRDRRELGQRHRRQVARDRAIVFLELDSDAADHRLHRRRVAHDEEGDEQAQFAFDVGLGVVIHLGGNFVVDVQRVQDARFTVDDLEAEAVFLVERALAQVVLPEMVHDRLFDHVHHVLEADPGADVVALDTGMDGRPCCREAGDLLHVSSLSARNEAM